MRAMKRQNGSTSIRVAVAAPFADMVRIHEGAAEYADELEVCAMISDADAVMAQTRLLQPDVLLLSEELAPDRPDTLARLGAVAPATRLLVLVAGPAGSAAPITDGVVPLDAGPADLRDAIVAAVAAGTQSPAPAAHAPSRAATPVDSGPGRRDPTEPPGDGAPRTETDAAMARTVLVFSGKGGVGTSVIATNLATMLAVGGARVVVVDLDLQFGDVGLLLHLEGHPVSIDRVAEHAGEISAPSLDTAMATSAEGVRVLPAPGSPEGSDLVTASSLAAIFDELSRSYDYVVVDSPAQLEERVIAVLEAADHVLLVSSFAVASVKDTRVTLRLLQSLGIEPDRVAVILNQTRPRNGLAAEEIERSLRFPVLCRLPYESRLDDSVDAGRPFVVAEPRSDFARQLRPVVEHLARARRPATADVVGHRTRRWRLRLHR